MKRYFVIGIIIISIVNACGQGGEVVPVPANLKEAVSFLSTQAPVELVKEIKSIKRMDDLPDRYDLSSKLCEGWRLKDPNNPLVAYFDSYCIELVPDDIRMIIMEAFWCELNGVEYSLEREIEEIKKLIKMSTPPMYSPVDKAPISWVCPFVKQNGIECFIGISISDNSFWRFDYEVSTKCEPVESPVEFCLLENYMRLNPYWRDSGIDELDKDWADKVAEYHAMIEKKECPECFSIKTNPDYKIGIEWLTKDKVSPSNSSLVPPAPSH